MVGRPHVSGEGFRQTDGQQTDVQSSNSFALFQKRDVIQNVDIEMHLEIERHVHSTQEQSENKQVNTLFLFTLHLFDLTASLHIHASEMLNQLNFKLLASDVWFPLPSVCL